ncbi:MULTISPECIES: alpha/beta hydrolase [Rhodococcus]|uniref:alpha/beta hydrolase n=1 Tax=Rhodococcus TaxID=1827 RepID=UPI001E39F0F3|nr:alpha/beta hydrolase [Rhodococcus pyridinivorans]MCD2119395.1 alpha/beta hydrolase [Rhodococcus pyridinivorans]MCZ4628283.1 alpha/beta hydrolase [Rhodococcus pyridinivorans]MCZ4649555.1 alpha/beta hydrolase [Rhodococcus pyridinivorans]MDJ0483373.1 alpha/beta hydrolase [Rhodococcus pyridinivorans]MDV7255598.1 alpha/beta hydrolase [Rhodococcus pyridinivorans]
MSVSKESLFLNDLYSSWLRRSEGMDLAGQRDMFEEWHLPTIEPTDVTYEEVTANGVPATWAKPLGAAEDRVIVFTHGGGFVTGSRFSHRKLAAHLAKLAGVHALVVDYRLAPEAKHPAQLEDCIAVHKWLRTQGYKAEHTATVGDSAGAHLAISTVFELAGMALPIPAAVVALSPWLDMEIKGLTIESNDAVDVLAKRAVLEMMRENFLTDLSEATDPRANPLLRDYTDFPPVYVSVGGYETLLDDSRRVVELIEKAGGEAVLDVVDEQQHVFHFNAGRAPEADQALNRIAQWLRPKLGLA